MVSGTPHRRHGIQCEESIDSATADDRGLVTGVYKRYAYETPLVGKYLNSVMVHYPPVSECVHGLGVRRSTGGASGVLPAVLLGTVKTGLYKATTA